MQSYDNSEPGRNNSSATGLGAAAVDATDFNRTPDSGSVDYSTKALVGARNQAYAGPRDAPGADDFGDDVSDDRSGSSESGRRSTGFLNLRRRLPHLAARNVHRHLPYAAAAVAALIALVVGVVVAPDSGRNKEAGNVLASEVSETSNAADATKKLGAIDDFASISDAPNDGSVPDDTAIADPLGGGVDAATDTTEESPDTTENDPAATTTDTSTSTTAPGLSVSVSASASFSVEAAPQSDVGQTAQPEVSPSQDLIITTTAPVTVTSSSTVSNPSTGSTPTETTTSTGTTVTIFPTTTQTVPVTTSTVPTTSTSIGRPTTSSSAGTRTPSGQTTTTSPRRAPMTATIPKTTERKPVPSQSQPTIAHPPTTPHHSPAPRGLLQRHSGEWVASSSVVG